MQKLDKYNKMLKREVSSENGSVKNRRSPIDNVDHKSALQELHTTKEEEK